MSVPRLNRLLTLETPQRSADGAGGFSQTWVPIGAVWAEIAARGGREVAAPGAAVSKVTYKITVRAAPHGSVSRPKADQRFRDGPRCYVIEAVAERDPEGRYLNCFAKEEVVA